MRVCEQVGDLAQTLSQRLPRVCVCVVIYILFVTRPQDDDQEGHRSDDGILCLCQPVCAPNRHCKCLLPNYLIAYIRFPLDDDDHLMSIITLVDQTNHHHHSIPPSLSLEYISHISPDDSIIVQICNSFRRFSIVLTISTINREDIVSSLSLCLDNVCLS